MSNFRSYMHVERLANTAVDGIEFGEIYVFPKIDGTNASLWLEDGKLQAGSRRRHLELGNDNAGFLAWALEQENIMCYLTEHPTHRLYGEWLVPHTMKTYRTDAWRKFYVFDIAIDGEDEIIKHEGAEDEHRTTVEYIPYPIYVEQLEKFGINHLAPLAIITDPSKDQLLRQLNNNFYLVTDGEAPGEGIVLKNYDYYNKYGRQVWAKIVRTEFVEKNQKAFGIPTHKGEAVVEQKIVAEYCTKALVEKTKARIINELGDWKSQYIPRLLNTVFHDIVQEDMWDIVQKHKRPTINFKTLMALTNRKVKEDVPEIFC